jgi:hypothetical protein
MFTYLPSSSKGPAQLPFVQLMDSVGDGSGVTNWNLDLLSTESIARVGVPSGSSAVSTLRIARIIVSVVDTTGFQAEEYGNLGSELTNTGIQMALVDVDSARTVVDFFPMAIRKNADYGRYAFDVDVKSWGAGDEMLVTRLTFTKFGAPLRLTGDRQLQVVMNDDMDGLKEHSFVVEGVWEGVSA